MQEELVLQKTNIDLYWDEDDNSEGVDLERFANEDTCHNHPIFEIKKHFEVK